MAQTTHADDWDEYTRFIFGDMVGSFSNTAPLVEWIAGQNSVGNKCPVGKSLIDILGTQYVDAGGNPDVDTIREHLVAGLLTGTGTVLPANKSLYDEIALDRLDSATYGLAALQALATTISNAILVLTETGGTVTTDGNEQNVYINNAPAGVYDPKVVYIDFTNHTAAETIVVKTYYRIKTGGGLIKNAETTYAGLQDPLLISVDLIPNRFGVKVTMQKTAGNNKAYDWEAVYAI